MRPRGEARSGSEPAEWGRVPPPPRAGAGAGPGARPAQPMGAALEPPPPPREESARGLRRGERERRAAPGPWVPRPRRAAWTARRPRKEARYRCGRQLRTRRPCARHIPSPSAPAPPASPERGAPGPRQGRLREARRPPRAHSAAGRRGCPGWRRVGGVRAFVPGGEDRRARDLPCCWAPWPRCAGALAAPVARAGTGGQADGRRAQARAPAPLRRSRLRL